MRPTIVQKRSLRFWPQAKKLSPVALGFLEYREENREQVIEQQLS